ncbi:50S ribosomal protein L25 [candidate division WOR-3 bacterium]|jgi:large subunit ribosomal protein L25|nr:50S ribosomal protein L25 [candidate division WOR-3 bacterium]
MNEFSIKADIRKEKGKQGSKRLRSSNITPGIIYGRGEKTKLIEIDSKKLTDLLREIPSESTVINLKIKTKSYMTIIQELQNHPLKGTPVHIDFRLIHKGETVRVTVPISLEGIAQGVKEGGMLEQIIHDIDIETIPSKIPERIIYNITNMNVGEKIYVKDLDFGDVKVDRGMDNVVAEIVIPHVKVEEEPEIEEEAVEPEVITEKKEEQKEEEKQK